MRHSASRLVEAWVAADRVGVGKIWPTASRVGFYQKRLGAGVAARVNPLRRRGYGAAAERIDVAEGEKDLLDLAAAAELTFLGLEREGELRAIPRERAARCGHVGDKLLWVYGSPATAELRLR